MPPKQKRQRTEEKEEKGEEDLIASRNANIEMQNAFLETLGLGGIAIQMRSEVEEDEREKKRQKKSQPRKPTTEPKRRSRRIQNAQQGVVINYNESKLEEQLLLQQLAEGGEEEGRIEAEELRCLDAKVQLYKHTKGYDESRYWLLEEEEEDEDDEEKDEEERRREREEKDEFYLEEKRSEIQTLNGWVHRLTQATVDDEGSSKDEDDNVWAGMTIQQGGHVEKLVKERITTLAVHPSSTQCVLAAGDKRGHVGIWHAPSSVLSTTTSNSKEEEDRGDRVFCFQPHASYSSFLSFDCQPHFLVSGSYDGTLRVLDLEYMSTVQSFYYEADKKKDKSFQAYGQRLNASLPPASGCFRQLYAIEEEYDEVSISCGCPYYPTSQEREAGSTPCVLLGRTDGAVEMVDLRISAPVMTWQTGSKFSLRSLFFFLCRL